VRSYFFSPTTRSTLSVACAVQELSLLAERERSTGHIVLARLVIAWTAHSPEDARSGSSNSLGESPCHERVLYVLVSGGW